MARRRPYIMKRMKMRPSVHTNPRSSSARRPFLLPTLLHPRIVVFDGVCHLCHGEKDEDVSPLTVARVSKVYAPNIVRPSISVAEGAKKANKVEEMKIKVK